MQVVSGSGTYVVGGELAGEGIWLGIPRSGVISECIVESPKEQCPPGLPGVQTFSGLDVGQVIVVRPHNEREGRALQPVTPFLKS